MTLIELIYDFFCWVNNLWEQNFDSIFFFFEKEEDLANNSEIKELLEYNIMTIEDVKILKYKRVRLTDDLGMLLAKAEKYNWSINKIELELKILLTKYKFSKSYINFFTYEFIERIKADADADADVNIKS